MFDAAFMRTFKINRNKQEMLFAISSRNQPHGWPGSVCFNIMMSIGVLGSCVYKLTSSVIQFHVYLQILQLIKTKFLESDSKSLKKSSQVSWKKLKFQILYNSRELWISFIAWRANWTKNLGIELGFQFENCAYAESSQRSRTSKSI